MKTMSVWRLQLLMTAVLLGWLGCAVQGQRLAVQKCAEYQNLTFEKLIMTLLPFDQPVIPFQFFNCTNAIPPTIGGEPVRRGEFPHHALLGFQKEGGKKWEYEFRCGGTLISEQHVLTAAHCFVDSEPEIVRIGEYNTETASDGVLDNDISRILLHPNFTFYSSYHDIALIKLEHPIRFTRHIRPACLWETEKRNTTSYIATGFGYDKPFATKLSTVMRKVQLDEFLPSVCERLFKNHRLLKRGVKDGQLCIGSSVDDRDICQGDVGVPLQVVINSKSCTYAVIGIISFGGVCGMGNTKEVYTKVSHYIDWIEDNVWGPNAM